MRACVHDSAGVYVCGGDRELAAVCKLSSLSSLSLKALLITNTPCHPPHSLSLFPFFHHSPSPHPHTLCLHSLLSQTLADLLPDDPADLFYGQVLVVVVNMQNDGSDSGSGSGSGSDSNSAGNTGSTSASTTASGSTSSSDSTSSSVAPHRRYEEAKKLYSVESGHAKVSVGGWVGGWVWAS